MSDKPVSTASKRRLSGFGGTTTSAGAPRNTHAQLTPMYAGIACNIIGDDTAEVGISVHDGSYTIDYAAEKIKFTQHPSKAPGVIENYVIKTLMMFSTEYMLKFIACGLTQFLVDFVPNMPTRLWMEMDAVPMVFPVRTTDKPLRPGLPYGEKKDDSLLKTVTETLKQTTVGGESKLKTEEGGKPRLVDEQADSAVRKCVMYFGPTHLPRLTIGYRNQVEVDANGIICLLNSLDHYRATTRDPTWNAVMHYAKDLRERKVKLGFFSSTPQGGGVALMRHALIRFLNLVGVDCKWYVPKPSPTVFRTTKNNHNILQGVAAPDVRLTVERQEEFTAWIEYNANRYWVSEGGPLAPGGVDVAFIDDPQMPGLIPLIKKVRPDLPIIYRSHIEIRSDLIAKEGSPQAEVWKYLWDRIQLADLFISHPVAKFVPAQVPKEKLTLLGATSDWLDGLGKPLGDWDLDYYMNLFRRQCSEVRQNRLHWPDRLYIAQIARFDPSKGIPDVIDSFCKLRKKLDAVLPANRTPQLLICGHGAIDDPDASIIYDETMALLEEPRYAPYSNDIIVMRIGPSDQILNALLSNATVVLQLSLREGFEVKVSEALHHGKPVIATRAGGIPLQIQHGKSGFLVDVGDTQAVADHLYDLWTNRELYSSMSEFARTHVSDEVSTIGNALAWLYLGYKFSKGEFIKPNGAWLNDLAREEAGEPYKDDEPRLPRAGIV
ncbi:glycosyltransferase family 4 protein [Ceratobasidium sp. AG-Ba]|nr:glycosyltransferase family 4 protein [Ceratobasidium sp. AG-Ba]QRW04460.1 glycosyltransferase family 4 protein [Ceratobasidium sp. AG-Ba]